MIRRRVPGEGRERERERERETRKNKKRKEKSENMQRKRRKEKRWEQSWRVEEKGCHVHKNIIFIKLSRFDTNGFGDGAFHLELLITNSNPMFRH